MDEICWGYVYKCTKYCAILIYLSSYLITLSILCQKTMLNINAADDGYQLVSSFKINTTHIVSVLWQMTVQPTLYKCIQIGRWNQIGIGNIWAALTAYYKLYTSSSHLSVTMVLQSFNSRSFSKLIPTPIFCIMFQKQRYGYV